ncbi:MAG: hypothetical protein AAGI68_02000 [Planctomycetota bacterium]
MSDAQVYEFSRGGVMKRLAYRVDPDGLAQVRDGVESWRIRFDEVSGLRWALMEAGELVSWELVVIGGDGGKRVLGCGSGEPSDRSAYAGCVRAVLEGVEAEGQVPGVGVSMRSGYLWMFTLLGLAGVVAGVWTLVAGAMEPGSAGFGDASLWVVPVLFVGAGVWFMWQFWPLRRPKEVSFDTVREALGALETGG